MFVKRILDEIEESSQFVGGYLPVYSLAAACGKFGEGHTVSPEGWIKADIGRKFDEDWFVSKVSGHSMEPKIPHNSYCVFRKYTGGSRQGLIVLAQHSGIEDPDSGGSYTVKRYKSEKAVDGIDSWKHSKITLESLNPKYDSIILPKCPEGEFKIIAEFIDVI